jgi:hypothetical protein
LVEGAGARHRAAVTAFAKELRATLARFERDQAAVTTQYRRRPGPKPKPKAVPPTPLAKAVPVAVPEVPVRSLRERLKERRQAE